MLSHQPGRYLRGVNIFKLVTGKGAQKTRLFFHVYISRYIVCGGGLYDNETRI